ncbi:MAG: Bax inhibitor-1/YccA family protein [Gemmatimonas sp.]
MESSNPAYRSAALERYGKLAAGEAAMTTTGTATKTLVLLLVTTFAAGVVWQSPPEQWRTAMMIGMIGGLIMAFATIFKPMWAPVTAPLYAVLEGMALGGISATINLAYRGLPMLAVGATLVTAVLMFVLYRTRIIKVTDRMRSVATTALLGLAGFYLVQILLGFFGVTIPFVNGSGIIGIGVSLFATGLASFFLLLDMDRVEQMVQSGLPKSMEWYGAFSFLLTLVWLYLEMLQLLRKLNSR